MNRVIGLIVLSLSATASAAIVVSSPDSSVRATLSLHEGQAQWFLQLDGKEYLQNGRLGLEIDGRPLSALETKSTQLSSHEETVQTVWGNFSHHHDHYSQLVWRLQETVGSKRTLHIIVRVYNDGAALRYEFPSDGGWDEQICLTDDLTEFRFADDYTAWAYDGEHDPKGPQPLSRFVRMDKGARLPLTVKCNSSAYLAVLEAAIFDHAPFTLAPLDQEPYSFRATLPDSTLSAGGRTSWRTVLVGRQPGDLLTSPVLFCLNPPCAIEETDWIKPGLAFWDWRAWGAKTPDGFVYGLDMASWKRFIDFASKHNVSYLVLDANWYGPEFDKNSDPRTSRDHLVVQPDPDKPNIIRVPAPKNWKDPIDVPGLIRYGKERGVGIILYFNDIARTNYPFEETLALFQQWGAAGIKYGFMKGKGQQKVWDTREIVSLCAKYHLLCDFHDGPVPPSGDRRTYPNYVTREFCHSQSDALRVFSPTGFCEQVFVNMVAGPLDMCNGMYTLKNPAQDRPKIFKNIETTIVAETARVMITFSGLSILPDCPEAYRARADLFAFISQLPMTWDETHVLHGEIGAYISMARRHGSQWFVASATNEQKRTLEIDLSFLEPNRTYTATLYEDAPDAHFQTNREVYAIRTLQVKQGDALPAPMAPGGGHCIHLRPTDHR